MQHSSDPSATAPSSSAPEPSASALAQGVDNAAQMYGLTGDSKQKLYLYAIQTSPPMYALWSHAATLRHESALNTMTEVTTALDNRMNTLTDLVRREYRVPRVTETMLKKVQRRFIVTTKVSYRSIQDRVKNFVAHNSQAFGLVLYTTDSTVRHAVNQVIDRDIHQCRGTFRKAIFAETISGRLLEDATNRICELLSAEVGTPVPRFIQAHIAQLRLIAHERITSIRVAEQAAAAQTTNTAGSGNTNVVVPAPSRRPRNDTGFWIAVHATFNELVNIHGVTYDNHEGWTQWENDVINKDHALFIGTGHFAGETTQTFGDDD